MQLNPKLVRALFRTWEIIAVAGAVSFLILIASVIVGWAARPMLKSYPTLDAVVFWVQYGSVAIVLFTVLLAFFCDVCGVSKAK